MQAAVQFAKDVLDMHERILELEWENERLREYERKYQELLGESLAHSRHMVGSLLTGLATGVLVPPSPMTPATEEANQQ